MAVVDYDGTQDLFDTVVRFTAERCGPCKIYAPLFEQASNSHDLGTPWVAVDVDQYPEVAREWRVMGIPAVFDHGKPVPDFVGFARERIQG